MTTATSESARLPVAWPVLRAALFAGLVAAIWAIKPGATAVLCSAVVMAGWAVAVLGREVERLLAIGVLVFAIVAGSVAAVWLFAIQPAIDRTEQRIERAIHPGVPDVADSMRDAAVRAKRAITSATGGQP